ncbi:hypothetical protein [Thalassospira sp. HJ]|uniref:hypothetical protein n=1 Tax=Thalassospira sp. HJ TaxID=1616823 RepID=UPI001F29F67E|nr:hypothetical protein [Thalassospira sp. HJ]
MTVPLVLSLYLEKNRGKKQFVFENFSTHIPQTTVLSRKIRVEFNSDPDGKINRPDRGTSFATKTGE